MRAQDWDKGSLLSMRTMNFAGSFPYESITVPVNIIIGEEDTFLLKTAKRVCPVPTWEVAQAALGLHPSCQAACSTMYAVKCDMHRYTCFAGLPSALLPLCAKWLMSIHPVRDPMCRWMSC